MALTLGSFYLLQIGCRASDPPWTAVQTTAILLLWRLPGLQPFVPEPPVSGSIMQGEPSVSGITFSLTFSISANAVATVVVIDPWSEKYQMLSAAACLPA